jgi:hypothetical protein
MLESKTVPRRELLPEPQALLQHPPMMMKTYHPAWNLQHTPPRAQRRR